MGSNLVNHLRKQYGSLYLPINERGKLGYPSKSMDVARQFIETAEITYDSSGVKNLLIHNARLWNRLVSDDSLVFRSAGFELNGRGVTFSMSTSPVFVPFSHSVTECDEHTFVYASKNFETGREQVLIHGGDFINERLPIGKEEKLTLSRNLNYFKSKLGGCRLEPLVESYFSLSEGGRGLELGYSYSSKGGNALEARLFGEGVPAGEMVGHFMVKGLLR